MEIHKPRPWRNMREFLKELGTIALGVVVALAAEQAVEWFHWQDEVKAARQAIHAEMASNNFFFARRIKVAPCQNRQLGEADRILADLEAKRAPGTFTTFQEGTGQGLSDSEWQSERAAQALVHFPRAELALMGSYYAQLENFRLWMRDEADAWRNLTALRHPLKDIPVSDLLRLRTALEVARNDEVLIELNAARQLRLSRQLGLADTVPSREVQEKFCSTNIEEYRAYNLSRAGR